MEIRLKVMSLIFFGVSYIANAGTNFEIEHVGHVCIEKSYFSMEEVFTLVSEDSIKYTEENCPRLNGAITKFRSLEIKNLNHGCPFGHQFEYLVKAKCIIP